VFCETSPIATQGKPTFNYPYLLWYKDIIAHHTESHILSFGDHISLFLSDSDPKILFEKAKIETKTNDLTSFVQTDCHLTTKFMLIKPSKAKFDLNGLNLLINGIPLERIGIGFKEGKLKVYGVIPDESLTWKQHINHINKKSQNYSAIKQVKKLF